MLALGRSGGSSGDLDVLGISQDSRSTDRTTNNKPTGTSKTSPQGTLLLRLHIIRHSLGKMIEAGFQTSDNVYGWGRSLKRASSTPLTHRLDNLGELVCCFGRVCVFCYWLSILRLVYIY